MTKRTDKIDFVAEPFSSTIDSTETLVMILKAFIHQLGARLTFTHEDKSSCVNSDRICHNYI
jgi:hypothetical protein